MVYTFVEGVQKRKGHHYSIDNPDVVLSLIKQYSIYN